MFEAQKTNEIRGTNFARRYFSGSVLDIGCGPDLVVPHARPFDVEHGDANCISRHLPNSQFDCVHSSHCLEHMRDPAAALAEWWSLVRPGGYLITVVPDEDLYEQGYWPSLFNGDHKWTFSVGKAESWSPVSRDVCILIAALAGAEVLSVERQDQHYDYRLQSKGQRYPRILRQISARRINLMSGLRPKNTPARPLNRILSRVERAFGVPIDQTMFGAVAQIQVIARKAL
jgi:SAM-dependent methyltransferase